MLFRLPAAIVLVTAVTARVSAQVEPNWNGGVNYSYDGAGNIYRMGTDTFKYDAAGRLVESKANGIQRNYAYDRYGNRTDCTHAPGTPSESDCQYGYTVNAAKNRIAGVTYDDSGNLQAIGARTYTYDALNMLTREAGGATPREYVYDANGERIAVYEVNASKWRWTFRDPSGKVLREFSSTGNGTANWKWTKDYIWRDSLLLATRQIEPGKTTAVTYRYHLDHLGTPRRITNDADQIVGIHGYHAFGPEVSGGKNEPALSVMKFTGHERDTSGLDSWDTLDYMHARYYNGTVGRFLSVDRVLGKPLAPQSWNRYSYARNNPILMVDPDGNEPRNIVVVPISVVMTTRDPRVRSNFHRSVSRAQEFFATADIHFSVKRFDGTASWIGSNLEGSVNTSQGAVPLTSFMRRQRGITIVVGDTNNFASFSGVTKGVAGPTFIGRQVRESTVPDELAHALGNVAPGVQAVANADPFLGFAYTVIANAVTDGLTDLQEASAAIGIGMVGAYERLMRETALKIKDTCPNGQVPGATGPCD